jgi:hypothetical protein
LVVVTLWHSRSYHCSLSFAELRQQPGPGTCTINFGTCTINFGPRCVSEADYISFGDFNIGG